MRKKNDRVPINNVPSVMCEKSTMLYYKTVSILKIEASFNICFFFFFRKEFDTLMNNNIVHTIRK